jgi:hypothetical protein
MFGSTQCQAAAVAVLALVIVPAPLLPPLGVTETVHALLGGSWPTAYLAAAVGLHLALYGALGVVAAFAVGPGTTRSQQWRRLVFVPGIVVGLAVLVRSLKLGHVPMLANAAVPMAACTLGVACGLLGWQHGWRALLVATGVLTAGLWWAYWPGVSSELSRATARQLRRIVPIAPHLPAGDARFGVLLQTVFAPLHAPAARPAAVAHNRAAILALGIALGHERLARYAGLERTSALVRAASTVRAGATLRGRADWARHYCLSAALAVVEHALLSEAGGLIKEELDALTQGSGFSFGDLMADRAGVRFAAAATASEPAARALQVRLQAGYAADDFFPPTADVPENLTADQFRHDYGGVGTARYRRTVRAIDTRLNRCAALVLP